MAAKVRTWVWVIVAVVVMGILGLVAMAGLGFYFVSRHVDTHAATPSTAADDFETVRKQFANQKPLIELDERGRFLRANTSERTAVENARSPEYLNVQAFDSSDERVVKMSIPFWLLRFKSSHGTISLDGNRIDLEDMKLTVEDLERYGPTIIVDHTGRNGDRVLVWSQ
jgi:hypothetical protein